MICIIDASNVSGLYLSVQYILSNYHIIFKCICWFDNKMCRNSQIQ